MHRGLETHQQDMRNWIHRVTVRAGFRGRMTTIWRERPSATVSITEGTTHMPEIRTFSEVSDGSRLEMSLAFAETGAFVLAIARRLERPNH